MGVGVGVGAGAGVVVGVSDVVPNLVCMLYLSVSTWYVVCRVFWFSFFLLDNSLHAHARSYTHTHTHTHICVCVHARAHTHAFMHSSIRKIKKEEDCHWLIHTHTHKLLRVGVYAYAYNVLYMISNIIYTMLLTLNVLSRERQLLLRPYACIRDRASNDCLRSCNNFSLILFVSSFPIPRSTPLSRANKVSDALLKYPL